MSQCPRCRIALQPAQYEDVTLENCPRCAGQWLDRAQMRALLDAREDTRDAEVRAARQRAALRGVPLELVREDLPCPHCAGRMEAFHYGGDSGIILDKCSRCGGLWLDGGELDKVRLAVEAAESGVAAEARRFSARLHEVEVREDARAQRDYRRTGAPLLTALADRVIDAGD